jgi:hypothetical protein
VTTPTFISETEKMLKVRVEGHEAVDERPVKGRLSVRVEVVDALGVAFSRGVIVTERRFCGSKDFDVRLPFPAAPTNDGLKHL